jgi:hypothetical protein
LIPIRIGLRFLIILDLTPDQNSTFRKRLPVFSLFSNEVKVYPIHFHNCDKSVFLSSSQSLRFFMTLTITFCNHNIKCAITGNAIFIIYGPFARTIPMTPTFTEICYSQFYTTYYIRLFSLLEAKNIATTIITVAEPQITLQTSGYN